MKILISTLTITMFWITFSQTAWTAPAPAEAGFRVIVHPVNELNTINQQVLAKIFLKKITFWPDNKNIMVIDLSSESTARRRFSEDVLERPVSAVRSYWQQLLFSGRAVPPPEFKNDQEVMDFVSRNEYAIGYISEGTELRGVKPLKVE